MNKTKMAKKLSAQSPLTSKQAKFRDLWTLTSKPGVLPVPRNVEAVKKV